MGAESLIIEATWGCGQVLVALLLVIVGAVSVRPADARAGYLLVAGGALVFLNACCGSLPTALMQSGQSYDTVELLFTLSSWSGLLLRGGAGLASILAAVMLARALLATEKPGGAA